MCGLVGCIGNINSKEQAMFRDMLLFDTVRGQDSTGVIAVRLTPNTSPVVEKELGGPTNLWDYGQSDTFNYRGLVKGAVKALIGHNRAATQGAVTVDNAHPFEFDHIYGSHNGSLNHTYGLEGHGQLDVDSQCIFKDILVNGVDHTWKTISGAAALTWWNDEDKALYIIRNEQRPLHFAYSERKDAFFWASEAWMIEVAAKRNRVDLFHEKDKEGKKEADPHIPMMLPHHLHKISATALTYKIEEVRELEKKSYQSSIQTPRTIGAGRGAKKNKASGRTWDTRSKQTQINQGWAGDNPRAEKDARDVSVILRAATERVIDGKRFHLLVGCIKGTSKPVEVYPTSMKIYNEWKERLKHLHTTAEIKLKHRPRIRYALGPSITPTLLCSTQGIKLIATVKDRVYNKKNNNVIQLPDRSKEAEKKGGTSGVYQLVPYFQNAWITPEQLRVHLASCSWSCGICGDPVGLEDADDLTWVSRQSCACKTCSENSESLRTLSHM